MAVQKVTRGMSWHAPRSPPQQGESEQDLCLVKQLTRASGCQLSGPLITQTSAPFLLISDFLLFAPFLCPVIHPCKSQYFYNLPVKSQNKSSVYRIVFLLFASLFSFSSPTEKQKILVHDLREIVNSPCMHQCVKGTKTALHCFPAYSSTAGLMVSAES